jgi:hypothetical protein
MYDIPTVGDTLKIKIHKNKGGGFYIGKVINTATLMDERSFAMVRLSRMYQNGIIQPVDLERKTMQIPLYVTEVWEFA